jgi:MoaA/NifB/PqqE/SkfB family radical SAM enzyme
MKKIFIKIKKFFLGILKYLGFIFKYRLRRLKYNHLFLNITSLCNSNCVFCEVNGLDHKNDLEFERIKKLIKEARDLGVRGVTFSGGEPFVYPKIWDLIDYTLSLGFDLNITSNGLLISNFSEEQFDVLKRLKNIFISLESADAKTHNQLRGGGDFFQKTVASIKKLAERNINVTIASVISNKNYLQIDDLIKFTKELGVREIVFQPLHVWTNYDSVEYLKSKDQMVLSPEESADLKEKMKSSIKFAGKIGVKNNLANIVPWVDKYFEFQKSNPEKGRWIKNILPDYKCLYLHTRIFVGSDGGLLPCAMLSPRDNVKDKSLEQALKSLSKMKREIRKGQFPPECDKCSCEVASNFTFSLILSPIKNRHYLSEFIKYKF